MVSMAGLSLIISMILIMLNFLISKKSIFDREKASPFECGFDPKSTARTPFSLRFFLIAVIFLIFDVEITIILPMPITNLILKKTSSIILFTFFITILIVGLLHEWYHGALDWHY